MEAGVVWGLSGDPTRDNDLHMSICIFNSSCYFILRKANRNLGCIGVFRDNPSVSNG